MDGDPPLSIDPAPERTAEAFNTPFEPVLRPRVIERLRHAARRRIALVVAPAGFGKSVAIRQYLETDGIEHLRFSVRKEHDSLVGFLRGLVVALEPIAPKASKSVAGAYEKASRGSTPVRDLAAWVAALLSRYEGTIVIDDLHFAVGDHRVIDLVSDIIELSTSQTRWLLSARSQVSLPYASWLAYGLMDELVDQSVLALTHEEADCAARSAGTEMQSAQVDSLLSDTLGWPAAFMFSLRSLRQSGRRIKQPGLAREVLYNYLAHQVLADLDEEKRTFMMETSFLSSIDARRLELGGLKGARRILQDLRKRAAFVSLEDDGIYRYHELFREFLEHELQCMGSETFYRAAEKMARVCERSGQFETAINLYVQIGDRDALLRVLTSSGAEILAAGHLEVIDSAAKAIGLENATCNILLLVARLKTSYGLDSEAEYLYQKAAAIAVDSDEQGTVAWRYAAHLARRLQFSQALAIVSASPLSRIRSLGLRSLLSGIRAVILSHIGDMAEAVNLADDALLAIAQIEDESTRVAIYSYGSFVYLKCQRLEIARKLATSCLEGALRAGNYELAVIACTQLYNIALDTDDDDLADSALETMLSSSSRGGDLRMRRIALMNMYDRAGMRGDVADLNRLRGSILAYRESDPKTWSECVAPTLAMESAWHCDFNAAVSILVEAGTPDFDGGQRILRLAELAIYSAAARSSKDDAVAKKYLREADQELERQKKLDGGRMRRARAILLLSKGLVLGDPAGLALARKMVDTLEVREGLSRYSSFSVTPAAIGFSDSNFERYAGLKKAITLAVAARIGLEHRTASSEESPLTPTEMQIARLLAEGRTSREIAELLDRSVLTVETHVRAIVRKLGGRNRREAVRRAKELGLLT